jgi:ribosome-associated protein
MLPRPRQMSHPSQPDPNDADDESLLSRTDARRAEREIEDTLARLSKQLVELNPRFLERLALPDAVVEAVADARAIPSFSARNRQLRVVRAALRDTDWSLIRARLSALAKHGTIPASLDSGSTSVRARAPQWVARLIGEGEPAIEDLLSLAPTADRIHLRNLIRRVHQASGPRRERAEAVLSRAIESLLR